MRLGDIIRAQPGVTRRNGPAGVSRHQSARPKNGRLLVAVIVAYGLMVALVAINLRLIRHPAVLGNGAQNSEISRSEPNPGAPVKSESENVETRTRNTRPEMTFYRDLTSEDDQHGGSGSSDRTRGKGNEPETGIQQKPRDSGTSRQAGNAEDATGRKTIVSAGRFPESPAERGSPSDADLASRTYTVQVGSFSHPSIAQQWALNWKGRGYDVELKPVARPNTGVTYRLYLGKFKSEKEADELVKRLKAKEGITAFRLMVPN
jgi:cell division septation protein DedD